MMLFLATGTTITAQAPMEISPFSRLGLGDFVFQNTVTTLGMGGFGAGFSSPFHVNLANPASLGSLRTASFEAGLFLQQNELTLNDDQATSLNGNLSYLSLGFALQNLSNQILDRKESKLKWGMNIALLPYTTVGYDVRFISDGLIEGQDTVQTRTEFSGSGGTNRIIWSNGVRRGDLAVGLTLGVLFGNLENDREVNFLNVSNSYKDVFADDVNVRGFIYDIGVQYEFKFNKNPENPKALAKQSLKVGVVGHGGTNFTTRTSRIRTRLNTVFSPILDTIQSQINIRETGRLPGEWTIGFVFRNKTNLLFGLDYTFSDWSSYENPAQDFGSSPAELTKSKRIATGLQWTPNATSYNRYLKRVTIGI